MENSDFTPPAPIEKPTHDALRNQTRDWTLYTHLSGLCCFIGIPSIVGPLVCWLAKKDEFPQIDTEGKKAINFHLTMLIVQFISIPLIFIIIGFFTYLGAAILSIVCTILAGIAASNGEPYSYPLAYRFLK